MGTLVFSLIAVATITYLLIRILARDPFADELVRSFLFPGFRAQRRAAKLSYLTYCAALIGIGIICALVNNPLVHSLALVPILYTIAGCLLVRRDLRRLNYAERNADPVFHGIALIVTWPLWKTSYKLQT